jgi:hypothetical protein
MSDNRRKGETVEQYALRLLSDQADGDLEIALELSCQNCAGHLSMGLCRVLRKVAHGAETTKGNPR